MTHNYDVTSSCANFNLKLNFKLNSESESNMPLAVPHPNTPPYDGHMILYDTVIHKSYTIIESPPV